MVVKGFQVKIFDVLIHRRQSHALAGYVVKGFQVKIFDVLIHLTFYISSIRDSCERLSGQDL